LGDRPYFRQVTLDGPAEGERPYLKKRWATERIADLERAKLSGRRAVANRERRVRLAVEHQEVTRDASFVVIERRSGERVAQAVPLRQLLTSLRVLDRLRAERIGTTHDLHGAQVKKAIVAVLQLVPSLRNQEPQMARAALGICWLLSEGSARTRVAV